MQALESHEPLSAWELVDKTKKQNFGEWINNALEIVVSFIVALYVMEFVDYCVLIIVINTPSRLIYKQTKKPNLIQIKDSS